MFKMMQNAPSSEYLFKVNYFKNDATNDRCLWVLKRYLFTSWVITET